MFQDCLSELYNRSRQIDNDIEVLLKQKKVLEKNLENRKSMYMEIETRKNEVRDFLF